MPSDCWLKYNFTHVSSAREKKKPWNYKTLVRLPVKNRIFHQKTSNMTQQPSNPTGMYISKKTRGWNVDGQAVRQHNAALLKVWAKETERGQTLPRGGLVYWPSNRKVGMGESGGETVSNSQTKSCMWRSWKQRGDITLTSLTKKKKKNMSPSSLSDPLVEVKYLFTMKSIATQVWLATSLFPNSGS